MNSSFAPRQVPGEIVFRWPGMAAALWKRSAGMQSAVLLAAALVMKLPEMWATAIAFVISPSLFFIAFCAARLADEQHAVAPLALARSAWPGALRLAKASLAVAVGFAALLSTLSATARMLIGDAPAADALRGDAMPAAIAAMPALPPNVALEFLQFCAGWTGGVLTMLFLGMFIVAIVQGVFGIVLQAEHGMGVLQSRRIGWQAWQVNSLSIEEALTRASAPFWWLVGLAAVALACAFESVWLSPVALLVATYLPCLAWVAYRSIFLGRHQNAHAAAPRHAAQSTLAGVAG